MKNLKALFKYTYKYKWNYILGILVLMFVDLLHIIPPKLLGMITDQVSYGTATKSYLLNTIMLILLVALLTAIGRFLWRILIFGTSKKIEYDIRNSYFNHLEKLSINFYNKNKTGDLMALATNDLNAVVHALGPGVIMIIDAIFLTAITIIIMLSINPKLTLISMIPLPFISLVSTLFGKKIHRKFLTVQKAFSKLTDMVQENFSGIRIVKSFVQEEKEFEKFTKENENNFQKNMHFSKIWSFMNPAVEFIASISFVVFIALGGYFVILGDISLGDFVSFNLYLGELVWPMMALGYVINILQRGYASLQRIETVMKIEPEVYDGNHIKDVLSINGDIVIDNLTFYYPDTIHPALNNIRLKIEKGNTLGIIGRTGSGKSTLVNLLVRLYNTPYGQIKINGYDINEIPLGVLRNNIGMVSDNFLFSTTITENINLATEHIDMENTIKAAKDSDVYDNIVDFPNGFDTLVGERGATLSGGQKQRISISRALIKDPEILILDDCLSAVDAKTETKILENLKSIMNNKTSIIISHRISAIKNSHHIIVLDEGKIVEEGTHEELISINGLYRSIYDKQLLEAKIQEEEENSYGI